MRGVAFASSRCSTVNLLKRWTANYCQNRTYCVKRSVLNGPRKRRDYRTENVSRPVPVYYLQPLVTSPLPPVRLGRLSGHQPLRTVSTCKVNFFSTSTDSRPTTQDGIETKDEKTQLGKSLVPVPFEDVRRLLHLAHPERWRLTGQ